MSQCPVFAILLAGLLSLSAAALSPEGLHLSGVSLEGGQMSESCTAMALPQMRMDSLWETGEDSGYRSSQLRSLSATGQILSRTELAPFSRLDERVVSRRRLVLVTEDLVPSAHN